MLGLRNRAPAVFNSVNNLRGEDDTRESLPSISEDSRRRASSQSDTIRSSRSDQSPRLQRSHNSVSCPPSTPPLSRATPHRHSISHAPGGRPAAATVIAVPQAASRDSLSLDSGNPSPDTTFTTSDRVSRSPPGLAGSESDSRSVDFDSLSVDESLEFSDSRAAGPPTVAESVSTVIHVPAAAPPPPLLDQSVQSAEIRGLGSPTSLEVRGQQASPSAEVRGPLPPGDPSPAVDSPGRPLSTTVETSL